MIFSLRDPAVARALEGVPQLWLEGLDEPDARALLSRVCRARSTTASATGSSAKPLAIRWRAWSVAADEPIRASRGLRATG